MATKIMNNDSALPDERLHELTEFALARTGGIEGSLAIRFSKGGRGGGYAADRKRHKFPRWAGRARFAIHVSTMGSPSYPRAWLCGHAKNSGEWSKSRALTAYEEGQRKVGRWPLILLRNHEEEILETIAHELRHIIQFERERSTISEVDCEEFAAQVLEDWQTQQDARRSIMAEVKEVSNPLDYRMTGNGQAYDIAEYGDGQFESGFFGAGQRAWHQLGTVIPEDVVTAERALEVAEMDWTVEPHELVTKDGIEVPKFVANIRQSDRKVLGVVGTGYEIVQNKEAFAFIDDLLDDSDAKFHTAGSLKGGEKVWILAKLPEAIMIGGDESEAVDPFILFSNDHTGNASIVVGPTPIRVVCRNTLTIAQAGMARQWKARHTSNVASRILEARRTLELTFKYYEQFEALGNELISKKMDPAQFGKFLNALVPYKLADDGSKSDRAAKNVDEARAAIMALYNQADNLANIRGTAWGAYNAVAEYADHDREIRGEKNRQERAWIRAIDDGTGLKAKALALVTA